MILPLCQFIASKVTHSSVSVIQLTDRSLMHGIFSLQCYIISVCSDYLRCMSECYSLNYLLLLVAESRLKVLDIMDECQSAPRPSLKENGPAYGE